MFFENLEIAIANDDSNTIMALLYGQISDLALKQPQQLHAVIKNSGAPVSDNLSPDSLVEAVVDNWENKKMMQGIANLIAHNVVYSGNYLYDGETWWGAIVRGVGGIVKGAGKIATAVQVTKVEKEKQKGVMFDILSAQKEEQTATLQRATAAKAKQLAVEEKYKKNKMVATSIIGITVLLLIGVLVYKNT